MTTPTSDLQYLLSLDSTQWQFMLDSHTIHLVLVAAVDSLTLTRNLITTIVTTRNKKYRRKYITEFTQLLAGVDINGKCKDALGNLVHLHKAFHDYHIDGVEAHIRSNETGHGVSSVYQIGDSKHYTSCLRSGIQRSGIELTDLTNEDFNNPGLYRLAAVRCSGGCNYADYVEDDEVKAFMSGEIQYCAVGKLYTEGGDGYLGRYRIHRGVLVGDTTNKKVYLLSHYYGIDSYREPILAKILEHYGVGNVYVTNVDEYVTGTEPVDIVVDSDGTYNVEISQDDSHMLLDSVYPKPTVRRTKLLGECILDNHGYIINSTGYEYYLNKQLKPEELKDRVVTPNIPTVADYGIRRRYTWISETHYCNVLDGLPLVTAITGNNYYVQSTNAAYSDDKVILVYMDTMCDYSDVRKQPNYLWFTYKSLRFKLAREILCTLSWGGGLTISTHYPIVIKGHKNIRKVIKLGLLNVVNKRLKTNYEALPSVPQVPKN